MSVKKVYAVLVVSDDDSCANLVDIIGVTTINPSLYIVQTQPSSFLSPLANGAGIALTKEQVEEIKKYLSSIHTF